MIKDIYKNNMKFELSKVHPKKTFNVIGNEVLNFAILQTKKKKELVRKGRWPVKLSTLFKYLAYKIQIIIF